ncbi:MAG: hypothetical protein H6710_01980 [Myxococcales bacterium]|nr:hypothetical protein [Myxococcales bacterium]
MDRRDRLDREGLAAARGAGLRDLGGDPLGRAVAGRGPRETIAQTV